MEISINNQKEFDFIKKLIDLIESKKGENIVVIDISNFLPIADYVIILTANSITHSKSLTKYILEFLNETEYKDILSHKNIDLNNPWILIDVKDIIIHIFLKETREFYSLEKLYFKGKVIYKTGEIR